MYYVYILANKTNEVLYIGVTNDLARRLREHRNGEVIGFTKRYQLRNLVRFEEYFEIEDAIAREKQLKHWRREKKNQLVEDQNPSWSDLSESFI